MQTIYLAIVVRVYSNIKIRQKFLAQLKAKYSASKTVKAISDRSVFSKSIEPCIILQIPATLRKDDIYIHDQFLMLPQILDAICLCCAKDKYSSAWITIQQPGIGTRMESIISIKIDAAKVGEHNSKLGKAVYARGALLTLTDYKRYEQFLQI